MALTLSDLVSAIGKGEGYGVSPTNRPTRTNNPGDLTGTGYAGQTGTDAQGFAVFSSPAAGQAALMQYLQRNLSSVGTGSGPYGSLSPSSTLADFLDIYAGHPPASYVSTVAQGIGVPPSISLAQLQGLLVAQGAVAPAPAPPGALNANAAPSVSDLLGGATGGSSSAGAGVGGGSGVSPLVIAGAVVGAVALALALS